MSIQSISPLADGGPGCLSISHLSVVTGARHCPVMLVDDLSLTVHRGRVQALVGASGSGKSMTCSAALDVLPPGVRRTVGQVIIDGVSQDYAALRGRRIASVMQNPRSAFNPVLTMACHARETLAAIGIHGPESRELTEASLLEVGLDEPGRVLPLHAFEMSGGMLQRMMIALALMSGAPFLFADEPTTDLDLVVQVRVLELLERLVAERDLGVLMVTHDMGVVARLADDVAVMSGGRLIEEASVVEIFSHPRQPETRDLISAHLSLYGEELRP